MKVKGFVSHIEWRPHSLSVDETLTSSLGHCSAQVAGFMTAEHPSLHLSLQVFDFTCIIVYEI